MSAEDELRAENDRLRRRLALAESVCVLYAWSPSRHETDRDKALHELWVMWRQFPGTDDTPEGNPELTDELIAHLARKRDETRARTLERFFGPDGPPDIERTEP